MEHHQIRHVTVQSLAAMLGVMALFWGILVALVWIVIGLGQGPMPGFVELVAVLIGGPTAGAVLGAVAAIFFNLAAVFVGGLDVELA